MPGLFEVTDPGHRRVWIEAAVWLIGLCLVLWAGWLWSLAVCAVALWRAGDHWRALDIDTRSSKSLDELRHVWLTECHDEPRHQQAASVGQFSHRAAGAHHC